jgi:hypothetical protein
LSFAGKWMELKNIIFSEVSQVQKAKGHIFSHIWNIDLIQIQTILYIHTKIYTEHVPKSGTSTEDQEMRKERW